MDSEDVRVVSLATAQTSHMYTLLTSRICGNLHLTSDEDANAAVALLDTLYSDMPARYPCEKYGDSIFLVSPISRLHSPVRLDTAARAPADLFLGSIVLTPKSGMLARALMSGHVDRQNGTGGRIRVLSGPV